MFKWIVSLPGKWWRRHCRSLDMEFLWPIVKKQAPTLEKAKAAFLCHIMDDPVWNTDYTTSDMIKFIEQLK